MPNHFETREVLDDSYRIKRGAMLSHLVEVGELGSILRVVCGKVQPLSMAGRAAADPLARPTCDRCGKKYDKLAELEK